MTRIAPRLALLLAITSTISCDRITKHVAVITLAGNQGRSFLADTLRLEYVENAGAFLNLGATWPSEIRIAVFGIANGLLLVALVTMAVRHRWSRLALLGVSVFAAGGASNLLDRIVYGSVIDFMNVGVGPLRTGIFNVADMAVMLGAGIVLWASCRSDGDVPEARAGS
jgi:signal peptidase II